MGVAGGGDLAAQVSQLNDHSKLTALHAYLVSQTQGVAHSVCNSIDLSLEDVQFAARRGTLELGPAKVAERLRVERAQLRLQHKDLLSLENSVDFSVVKADKSLSCTEQLLTSEM